MDDAPLAWTIYSQGSGKVFVRFQDWDCLTRAESVSPDKGHWGLFALLLPISAEVRAREGVLLYYVSDGSPLHNLSFSYLLGQQKTPFDYPAPVISDQLSVIGSNFSMPYWPFVILEY